MLKEFEIALQRIEEVQSKMKSFVTESLKELEPQIIDLQVAQTTEHGEDGFGNELPGPYAPFTIEMKKSEGKRYDFITLDDTGDFHRDKEIIFREDEMEITSTDWKTDMLTEAWGIGILGLQEKNKEAISQELKEYLPPYIKPILNGNN